MITEIPTGPLLPITQPISPLRRLRMPCPPTLSSALMALFMAVACFYCQPRPARLTMPTELATLLLTMHVRARSKSTARAQKWLALHEAIEQIAGDLSANDPAVFRALAQARIALLRE